MIAKCSTKHTVPSASRRAAASLSGDSVMRRDPPGMCRYVQRHRDPRPEWGAKYAGHVSSCALRVRDFETEIRGRIDGQARLSCIGPGSLEPCEPSTKRA